MIDDILADAEPIAPRHTRRLRTVFSSAAKQAWCYYPVFMCCYSLPPGRRVYVIERDGAVWLPIRRETRDGPQVDLLVPPVPFSLDAVESFAEEAGRDSPRPLRVQWVDGSDARQMTAGAFSLRPKGAEYVYDPRQLAAAKGRAYRDVRKRVNGVRRLGSTRLREMNAGDGAACMELLEYWRRRRGRRNGFLLDWGYTRAAIERYGQWQPDELQGWVFDLGGRVAGFAMAGGITEDTASFFILKTDPDIAGLAEYMRWEVCRALSGFRRVNDAGDLGLPGLRRHKRKLRPVELLPVYAATARR